MSGCLYGVGVGPGDPELMTLKAVRILKDVPVVAYLAPEPSASDNKAAVPTDRHSRAARSDDPRTQKGIAPDSLGPRLSLRSAEDDNGEGSARWQSTARSIAKGFIPAGCEEIPIYVAMRPGPEPEATYDRAAERLAAQLSAGRDVAVLCEGDPFFYGSFAYLHDRLSPHFTCVVVPGVSSLTACAATSGRALVRRDDGLVVLPATLPDDELKRRLALADAAAILKVGRHLPRLKALLGEMGLTEASTYVAYATRDDEKVVALVELGEIDAPYFSMILVTKERPR